MPHEVITLQLGNYANYVGAHFWNIQASKDACIAVLHTLQWLLRDNTL